ncbi:DUF4429 domain-containing protein [Nocardiopsis sp. RSe5-2]|uniref:DUF4429 domain-containing protein n=1 Tax=Nocardiopsis endophytica TaxID=3018445 RepID=A0ABT4U565_9ACTN|nr:DUF4429 domain-containing protein [Nocardiopsis endophytica]MDA2811851.1 DUF4429 domain-containing protein [Nocardiopsis endophytica]
MSDLSGHQGTWTFGADALHIDYADRWRVHRLLRLLRRCSVPYAAVAGVDFQAGAGRRRWRLAVRLADGADPFAASVPGAEEKGDPFELTGPSDTVLTAEYQADQLRVLAEGAQTTGAAPDPGAVARSLVPAPPFKAYCDGGEAVFDGAEVRLHWKRPRGRDEQRRGGRVLPLDRLVRVEWVPADQGGWAGIRFTVAGEPSSGGSVRKDPAALGSQDGREQARLRLLAAVVNAHLPTGAGAAAALGDREGGAPEQVEAPAPDAGPRSEPEEVSRRIRELAALRDDGLVTEEEFAAKKAELLRRL